MTLSLQCAEVGPEVAEALLDRIRLAQAELLMAAGADEDSALQQAVDFGEVCSRVPTTSPGSPYELTLAGVVCGLQDKLAEADHG